MTQQQNDNFTVLYEVSQTINAILDDAQLLETVLEIAMKHLNAERGFVLVRDEGSDQHYSVAVARNFSDMTSPHSLAASSSVVKSVLSTGEAVLTFDALSDDRFESSTSIIAQKILSIICVPLRYQENIIGAVYLDSTKSRKTFSEDALKFLTIFGSLAAIALHNAQRFTSLQKENLHLRQEVASTHLFAGIIGESAAWKKVMEIVQRVLDVDVAVLITGESGTGKELIARTIHDNGPRSAKPFVAVNCSAIPEQLLESELFGYMKGAFTGANSDKKGLFEFADGGTIFLDEIGEMPMLLQAKLLRVLQEKEIRRVGDNASRKINVRVIAATNKELQSEVKEKRFREDLYFRLNVVGIHLPPLRDRIDDIPVLARTFFQRSCKEHNRDLKGIDADAMKVLMTHPWQGNVRELNNVIERAVVLCTHPTITAADLMLDSVVTIPADRNALTLEDFERQIISATLKEMNGNRTRTAEKLGVSLRWLQYRIKEWNIEE